ncbi:hypothetical protein AAB236_005676 [Klebsiella pneumoniae]
MQSFEREARYLVAKIRDVEAALTDIEKAELHRLMQKVDAYRTDNGKDPLECVVVESDWPNYQSTWDSVQRAFEAKQAG